MGWLWPAHTTARASEVPAGTRAPAVPLHDLDELQRHADRLGAAGRVQIGVERTG